MVYHRELRFCVWERTTLQSWKFYVSFKKLCLASCGSNSMPKWHLINLNSSCKEENVVVRSPYECVICPMVNATEKILCPTTWKRSIKRKKKRREKWGTSRSTSPSKESPSHKIKRLTKPQIRSKESWTLGTKSPLSLPSHLFELILYAYMEAIVEYNSLQA